MQEQITISDIQLRCENAHLVSFPQGSFDFIYSLGMFGNGCPVTIDICNKFHDWLRPGGKILLDAVDVATLTRECTGCEEASGKDFIVCCQML